MTYRIDGDAWLLERHELARALVSEADLGLRERMVDELADMDRARRLEARRVLPVVASARIASPCHETFEAMTPTDGDGAMRSCTRCDQEVFDLAQMTLARADALITARRGARTCVRLHRRLDGTLMFADCEVGARGVRGKRFGALVAATVIASAAIALVVRPPHVSFAHPAPHGVHRVDPSGVPYAPMMGLMQSMPASAPSVPFSPIDPSITIRAGS